MQFESNQDCPQVTLSIFFTQIICFPTEHFICMASIPIYRELHVGQGCGTTVFEVLKW